MQSKIIIGLTLIISILLVEVSFPKKNRIISNEANLKKVEKQKLTQSKKIDSPITKASNRPVENQTIIQITTLTDTKKNAGTDSKVGAFINGDKKKYLRLDSPSLNDYKNGATNSYSLIANSAIQDINHLTITIDGNDAWRLKSITIRLFSYSLQKQVQHKFEVNKWFSSEQKDIDEIGAIKSMSFALKNKLVQSSVTRDQVVKNKRISEDEKIKQTKKVPLPKQRSHETLKELQAKARNNAKLFDKGNSIKPTLTKNGNLFLRINKILLLENDAYSLIVDFTKIDNKQNYTDYRRRIYDKTKHKESHKSGRLFENRKTLNSKSTLLNNLDSELFITIKNHEIEWSNGGPTGAWLYLKDKGKVSVLDDKFYESHKFK